MIQANELRIGNLVYLNDKCKIWEIMDGFDIDEMTNNTSVDPILLNEELLLKLGFKQAVGKWGNDFHILEKDGFICMFTIEHWTDTKEDSKFKNHWHCKYQLNGNKLKYVHEVQNLFFSLCGEELVFSSTEP